MKKIFLFVAGFLILSIIATACGSGSGGDASNEGLCGQQFIDSYNEVRHAVENFKIFVSEESATRIQSSCSSFKVQFSHDYSCRARDLNSFQDIQAYASTVYSECDRFDEALKKVKAKVEEAQKLEANPCSEEYTYQVDALKGALAKALDDQTVSSVRKVVRACEKFKKKYSNDFICGGATKASQIYQVCKENEDMLSKKSDEEPVSRLGSRN